MVGALVFPIFIVPHPDWTETSGPEFGAVALGPIKFHLQNQFGFLAENVSRNDVSADARGCGKVPSCWNIRDRRAGASQQVFTLRNVMCAHSLCVWLGRNSTGLFLLFSAQLKQANQEVNGPNLLVIPQDMCNVC